MIASPEVVLLGVELPDMSGIDVCRQLKVHPQCDHAVVILVTAHELAPDVVLEGFAAGADMCLRDELEAAALAGFIDAAIRRRHTVLELQHDSSQAQLELGETLRRYRSMFEHAPYGIYHVLEDGTVLDGNRVFVDLLGCSSLDDARRVNMNSLYEDPAARPALVERWRTKGTRQDETSWLLPDGRRIHVSLSGRVLEQNAEVFEVFVEDITARKRLESDFHHKRKMEAIGRLAGGIAHDLNNWLTVIVGYAEMLLDDATESAMRDGLHEILSASRASTSITKNLLTFSRKQVIQLQTIDLNQVVSEFHQLVQRIIGEQIQVGIEVPSDPVRTRADPTQIQQVLMNLAINARDAMPQGGRLTVQTGEIELHEYSLADKRVEPGSYAFVLVRDTGVGMTPEVRERLFEPFFTTKEAGKGTGLGMAVVYGVVKQLGGYITVDSKPGVGTAFTMYFPAAEAEAPRAEDRIAPSAVTSRSAARTCVLLVEDEEPVRLLTKRVLERAGYDVVTAADAEEALHIFERDADRIGLVLTDVVMPGMSGPDMLSRMLAGRPVPALLMSGYPDVGDLVAASGQFGLIAKPFTADVLTSAIRGTIERAHGSAASR